MKQIVVNIPEGLLEALDLLVENRYYPNRAEAIRIAVGCLVKEHGQMKHVEVSEGMGS